ncbi:MAG: hypothetical protein SFV81_28175 [Pirellulaceae bacterium]|nr:hypothetical protein [Pirellulaceae bacterium]
MERSKRIATTFIGVAFAANCYQPVSTQAQDRFIRQPAKAAVNTTPVSTALAANEGPAATGPTPAVTNPKAADLPMTLTPPVGSAKASDALGSDSTKPSAAASRSQNKTDSFLSFPSLLPLAITPDLSFDAIESLATVPQVENEKGPELDLKQAALPAESSVDSAAQTRRAGQLQWTSRANKSRTSTQSYNSQSQSNAHSPQGESSFAPRTSAHRESSQSAFQSASMARQESDSTKALLNRIAGEVDSIKSKVDAKVEQQEEPANESRIRASLVSARITNDPRYASQASARSSVTRIESPQGWQAIGTRLGQHVRKCESLLGRGAFCSAREEAETASMLLYRHIDLHDNLFRCEPAAQSANQALREAEDFLVTMRSTADGEALRRLVDAHTTPALKNKNLSGMSPLTAAQHYRQFAEAQLVEAAQGHPWASELLYTVGRTYQAEADADSSRVDVLRMKAMAYYRAARITLPSNAIACNQLGYLLLQMDRNAEARGALIAAVTLKPEQAFLSNLAEASRRLGDTQTSTWAAQSADAIRRRTPPPSPVPPYVEVSQEDFIAISPREIGPKTQAETLAVPGPKSVDRSAAVPNTNQLR